MTHPSPTTPMSAEELLDYVTDCHAPYAIEKIKRRDTALLAAKDAEIELLKEGCQIERLDSVNRFMTICERNKEIAQLIKTLEWAKTCVPYPSDCHTAIEAALAQQGEGT